MRKFGNRPQIWNRKRKGLLFVLSAPSGSGKTTLLAQLLKREKDLFRSVSVTTRPPRSGETQGRDYRFVGRAEFGRMKARGEFLEHARILGHGYGTPRKPIERELRAGKDAVLGLDIQGARQLRRSGLTVVTIFVLPPSWDTLHKRLRGRGTETPGEIRARLCLARRELKELSRYDYGVVNDMLPEAVADLKAILRAERHRVRERKSERFD